jgi:LacI family transcriptional regulator
MNQDTTISKGARDSYQAQVENYLSARIESGEWPVGSKIPSERELEQSLDVSRTTVRNAVLALTARGLFERAIGQGTFVKRRPAAKPEAKAEKGTVGYVVCKAKSERRPLSSEYFYLDIFYGLEEESSSGGRHAMFAYLDDFDPAEVEAFDSFLAKVDGVVVEEARNPEFLLRLKASGLPVLLLAPTAAMDGFDLVTTDLALGVAKAVAYLRGLGHERIAMIDGPLRLESARIRHDAFAAALREAGQTVDADRFAGDTGWTAEAGAAAARGLAARSPRPTAVVCANDLLAFGALSGFAAAGLRVPQDVSVLGFDDTDWARLATPPLTAMRIHSHEMARTAARRLLERIAAAGLPAVKIEFPIDLVERKSCAEVEKK